LPRAGSASPFGIVAGAGNIRREVLSPGDRIKLNRDDDRLWYSIPRLVQHSDPAFRRRVTQLYSERIPDGGSVLDLCSSWVSHLPEDKKYEVVVGHGLNAVELSRNERLDEFFVRDLNKEPDGWALGDKTFDAVLCCCSVQYMQQPERVFSEVLRVLKPGGVCIVTFTNRLFYEKAVSAWRDGTGYSRTQFVKQYFGSVDGFTEPETLTKVRVMQPSSLAEALTARVRRFFEGSTRDPFHAVVAYRGFRPLHE